MLAHARRAVIPGGFFFVELFRPPGLHGQTSPSGLRGQHDRPRAKETVMSRRYAFGCRLPAYLAATCLALAATGCPADEHDPQTWIEKLDDRREAQEAIVKLQ